MTRNLAIGSRIFQGICLLVLMTSLVKSQTTITLDLQSLHESTFEEKNLTNINQDGNDIFTKNINNHGDDNNAQLLIPTTDKNLLNHQKIIEINTTDDDTSLEEKNYDKKEPTTTTTVKSTRNDDGIKLLHNDTVVNYDKPKKAPVADVIVTNERNSKLIENLTNSITDPLEFNKLNNLKYESESKQVSEINISGLLKENNNKTLDETNKFTTQEKAFDLTKESVKSAPTKEILPELYSESSTNNPINGNQENQSKDDLSTLENTIYNLDDKKSTITESSILNENNHQQFKPLPDKRSEISKINLLNPTINKNDEKNSKTTIIPSIILNKTYNGISRNPEDDELIQKIGIIDLIKNNNTNDNLALVVNSTEGVQYNNNNNNNNNNKSINIDVKAEISKKLFLNSNITEQTTKISVATTSTTSTTTTTTPPSTTNNIFEESTITTASTTPIMTLITTLLPLVSSPISTSTSFIPSTSDDELEETTITPSLIETTTPDAVSSITDSTTEFSFDYYGLTDFSTTETTLDSSTIMTTESTTITQEVTTEINNDSMTTEIILETTSSTINDIISETIPYSDEKITTEPISENFELKKKVTIGDEARGSLFTKDINFHSTTPTSFNSGIEDETSNLNTIVSKISSTTISSIQTKSSVETKTNSLPNTTNTKTTTTIPIDIYPRTTQNIDVLVKIVVNANWTEVCQHLPKSLANLLSTSINETIWANQIIFQTDNCASKNQDPVVTLYLYVINQNGQFDRTLTEILPSLCSSPSIQTKLTISSCELIQNADSGNAIAVVIVCCVAFICLVLLAGLLFIMRKRQTRFNYGERCRPVSLDAYSLDSVSAYNSVRRKGAIRASKRSYGNPTFEDSSVIPSHPLNFSVLSKFCTEENKIYDEYSNIPQVIAKIDELPSGADIKNRYANVIPLPETRVPLTKINNDILTEYINASYVRGPKNATKYYIACQAPMETTVGDFWRMIWEQQTKVIIMLTELVENDVEKCAEYIPPSEVTDCHRLFGDFQITLKKRETKEKYAISTLHLKNLENNTYREISHIWYLWPTNGIQTDAVGMIAVLLEARALQRGGPGPIVVHCSPGTGRTGTLIAIDLGIRQYEITRTVDVPRVVYTIRRDRAGAVQTKEQYAFIYKALNLYATKLAGGCLEST